MIKHMMDSLIHPIKSRLLMEISDKKEVTTKQLAAALPDIPHATLYRYVNRMYQDGLIILVSENRIRGVTEKVYSINLELQNIGLEFLEQQGGEGYLLLFTQFMTSLLKEFRIYAKKENIDLQHDGSGFSTCPVYVTTDELQEAMLKVANIIQPLTQNEPAPGRKYHAIATIITPPREN